jgi:hypothetical protein
MKGGCIWATDARVRLGRLWAPQPRAGAGMRVGGAAVAWLLVVWLVARWLRQQGDNDDLWTHEDV